MVKSATWNFSKRHYIVAKAQHNQQLQEPPQSVFKMLTYLADVNPGLINHRLINSGAPFFTGKPMLLGGYPLLINQKFINPGFNIMYRSLTSRIVQRICPTAICSRLRGLFLGINAQQFAHSTDAVREFQARDQGQPGVRPGPSTAAAATRGAPRLMNFPIAGDELDELVRVAQSPKTGWWF